MEPGRLPQNFWNSGKISERGGNFILEHTLQEKCSCAIISVVKIQEIRDVMDTDKRAVVKKVLDYWYTMEFLGQDRLPTWQLEDRKRAEKARKELEEKQAAEDSGEQWERPKYPVKAIRLLHKMEPGQEIYWQVKEKAKYYGMKRWSKITLYIGEVEREVCIRKITELLSSSETFPEKNRDKIAWCSIQLGPDGRYIEGSFSLSPILWAISRIKGENMESVPQALQREDYLKEVASLNSVFAWVGEEGKVPEATEDDSPLDEQKEYYKESEYALAVDMLYQGLKEIEKSYVSENLQVLERSELFNQEKGAERNIYLSYQLYADEQEKEHLGEDEYQGLDRGYFLSDLEMLRARADLLKTGTPMEQTLFAYIYSGYEEYHQTKPVKRTDLLVPDSVQDLKRFFQEWMDLEKAPLGKWPSKFRPAFMQQLAINLAISGKENIFSVNGPPGTGKTTLLKEIIVSHVVERARLLAAYETPDDAFQKNFFKDGNKPNQAYSKRAPAYYTFRNDEINSHSILIASSNNKAVENITKELPLRDGILNGLQADGNGPVEEGLKQIRQLFMAGNEEKEEDTEAEGQSGDVSGKTDEKKTVRNIYFTSYAIKLMGKGGDAWGLAAAALGKRSNLRWFYQNVMRPLNNEHFGEEAQLKEYRKIRGEFQLQLGKVLRMREDLRKYASLENVIRMRERDLQHYRSDRQRVSGELASLQEEFGAAMEQLQEKLKRLSNKLWEKQKQQEEAAAKWQEANQEWERFAGKAAELQEKITSIEKGMPWYAKWFSTKMVQESRKSQETLREQQEPVAAELNLWKGRTLEYQNAAEKLKAEKQQLTADYEESLAEEVQSREAYQKKLKSKQEELKSFEDCESKALEALLQVSRVYDEKKKAADTGAADVFAWLDDEFMEMFLSGEEPGSTTAQLANPWFTQEYDREREKLFYDALRLHEAFIRASRAVGCNLYNLGLLWQFQNGDDNSRVEFSQRDKANATKPLLQTLFLLVPAISTTFASVGTFLGQTGAGTVGTLIVDEAGQAAPQMAAGALYRAKKAIIVGDPKQLMPVVTDDLKVLREAYPKEPFLPYTRKDTSVQITADFLNPYGTWFNRNTESPEWVGCPLVVHRRCISPMFDISNELSYNGIMKKKTAEPDHTKSFCYNESVWFDVKGDEIGGKNHYVESQGVFVWKILEKAFEVSDQPDIFVITPFTSVRDGVKALLKKKIEQKWASDKEEKRKSVVLQWLNVSVGTVHSFQGKEANEVIFLLGCDNSREASGAIKFVNTNLVNVAVTRAKYRLYVVGDVEAWKKSDYVRPMREKLECRSAV